jgi:hypothetical protein
MSMVMMAIMWWAGRSLWTMPNLIAVMWMGPGSAGGALTGATLVGFLTHMSASILMGIISVPFLRDLKPARTFLAAVSYQFASYPVVIAGVMVWAASESDVRPGCSSSARVSSR